MPALWGAGAENQTICADVMFAQVDIATENEGQVRRVLVINDDATRRHWLKGKTGKTPRQQQQLYACAELAGIHACTHAQNGA